MKVLQIHGRNRDSTLLIGERIQNLKEYVPAAKLIVITDTNVAHHYRSGFPPAEVITLGSGEKIKDLDTVRDIYRRLLELEADRSTFIVGIGGGIVCDIAGFVASTYLRGLRFGFAATTLLAQVDAGVGGKNGVNFSGYKNIVGVFNQPEFVLCDLNLLRTLPEKEILCGLAEIVKHAAIADADLFAYLEDGYAEALALDEEVIEKLVYESAVIKSSIVNKDEKEEGERRKLNFGHTFGHAFEKITKITHGEAVGAGMVLASAFSLRKGLLSAEEDHRIKDLLSKLKLPTRIHVDRESLIDAIGKDKKRVGENLKFVFLNGLGNAVVEDISFQEMRQMIKEEMNPD